MNSGNSDDARDLHPSADEGDWMLIAEYVTGRAAPDVKAAVEARQSVDASFREDIAAARLTWQRAGAALGTRVTVQETERAWLRLAADLGEAAPSGQQAGWRDRTLRRRPRPMWRVAALAAAVIAVLAVGITFTVDRLVPGAGDVAQTAMRDIVASRGQRVAITLPDGGRILLAPGSRLQAPERFDGAERRVTLSGRAYFEVAHDPARPFIVETDGVQVRVLGTEFDLRAWGGAAGAEVVVRSGSVAVRPTGSGAAEVLEPGDRGSVDTAGNVTVEEGVNVDALLSWTTGRLVYERVALAEVVADLERWHDVTIELSDSALATHRLTAAFDREPLDIVLATIGELVNARVQRDGSRIVFSPVTAQ